MKRMTARASASLPFGLAVSLAAGAAFAQDAPKIFPFKVNDVSSGTVVPTDYMPLEKAEKPHNICVLVPHMKDSFVVSVVYGVITQAQAMGVNVNVYQAGGYENLPKQLSQFDDCMAAKTDAVVIIPISEVGLSKKFAEAKAANVPVVVTVNPVTAGAVPAAIFTDFTYMGYITGEALSKSLPAGEVANVVTFPGPPGSGWAEAYNDGFKDAVKDNPAVTVLGEKFGDTGVAAQLQLIQDALQAYPDVNVIWGAAPAIEAAIGAVQEAGRPDIKIIAEYENQAMPDALARGDIMAYATQYPVAEGAIAIDQAVRLLEGKDVIAIAQPIPSVITKETGDAVNMQAVFAPTGWDPVYSYSVGK